MKIKRILFTTLFIIFIIIMLIILKRNMYHYQPYTIVEESKYFVISATIPKTNTKLDNIIDKFIDRKIKSFKDNSGSSNYLLDRCELNIDYEYYFFNDKYVSTVLKIYEYDGTKKNIKHSVVSYFYDVTKNKELNILDFFKDKDNLLSKIKNKFEEQNIFISNFDNITLSILNNDLFVYYANDNLNYITISLNELDFKIKIDEKIISNNNVIAKETSNIIDPTKKVIAITFDDGPSKYTEEIIKTLKDNDCNATFFVLGNKVEAYKDVLEKSIKYGNEIGNHTYNHKWLSRLSTNEIEKQIAMTQDILKNNLNYTPTFLRPTYGSVNQKIRNNTDLKIALWTIDTKDWKIKSVDRIVEKALKNIEDGDIILMHDVYERTSNALKKLIPILKEEGFQLVTLSELEEVKLLRSGL